MKQILLFFLSGIFLFTTGIPLAQATAPDHFQKGMVSYNLGNYQEALQSFDHAIDDNPDSWEAYQQAGYCYFHLDQRVKMLSAFDESLKLHPDNAELKEFIKNSVKAPTPTPIPAALSTPTQATTGHTPSLLPAGGPEERGNSPWLNLSGGFGYESLGDLVNAANFWNQQINQYHDQGNASVANLGFQCDLEIGDVVDPTNAFSLQVGFETGHGFQEHLVYSSPVTQNINPQLFTFGWNYYHYIPVGDTRFILTGGFLFGLALVDYYQDDPIETIQGPLSGNNLGFTLGVGAEWPVSSRVGFQMMGRFRYLSITHLQNNFNVGNLSSGQAVLAKDSQGTLGLATQQDISNGGLSYAVMDYTGFNLICSFNFYL